MSAPTNSVVLGGHEFVIVDVPWKNLRRITPIVLALYKSFGPTVIDIMNNGAGKSSDGSTTLNIVYLLQSLLELQVTDEQFDDITQLIVILIQGGQPSFTLEQFNDMPVSLMEIKTAFPNLINALGLFKLQTEDEKKSAITEGSAPGEAPSNGPSG